MAEVSREHSHDRQAEVATQLFSRQMPSLSIVFTHSEAAQGHCYHLDFVFALEGPLRGVMFERLAHHMLQKGGAF